MLENYSLQELASEMIYKMNEKMFGGLAGSSPLESISFTTTVRDVDYKITLTRVDDNSD